MQVEAEHSRTVLGATSSFIGVVVEILLLDRAVLKKHGRCRFIFPCYV